MFSFATLGPTNLFHVFRPFALPTNLKRHVQLNEKESNVRWHFAVLMCLCSCWVFLKIPQMQWQVRTKSSSRNAWRRETKIRTKVSNQNFQIFWRLRIPFTSKFQGSDVLSLRQSRKPDSTVSPELTSAWLMKKCHLPLDTLHTSRPEMILVRITKGVAGERERVRKS